jgi:hypothetical protein
VIAALSSLLVACGPGRPAEPPGPPPVPLHLSPSCDLAPAAGLSWIVDARPRAIAEIPDLIPAIGLVVSEQRWQAFADAHGGVDVRQIQDLCVARYAEASLTIARAPFDPARVESGFAQRVTVPGGRAVDVPNPPVVRLWGEVTGERQQLVIFGRELLVLEQGKAGPARVAEAFAQGKLKRAAPALRGAALARASALLGEAPLRVLAPGPFEGEAAQGLGGLLRATTAVAGSARFAGPPARIEVKIVLMGAWGDDAPAAAERFAAAAHVIAESSMGRLFGVDRPVDGPRVRGTAEALELVATVDGLALARGLHDALDAEVSEILRR